MEQKITVYNEKGDVIGVTFNRRAKQLIIKRRAIWLDSTNTSICLASPHSKEDVKLYTESIESNRQNRETPVEERSSLYEDDKLLHLTHKKVKARRKLISHIMYYIFGTIILLWFLIIQYTDSDRGVYFGIWLTWSGFILKQTVNYFARYAKSISITRIFQQDPVEAEYRKLKAMEPEEIARNMKKYSAM